MLCLENKEMQGETNACEHPIIQKWLFYPDEWDKVNSPEEHETLKKYAQDNNFNLITRSAFINNVLLPFGVFKGYRIIGFNLPFDLSRSAIDCGKTRGRSFKNGFSLSLSENLRVRLKSLGKTASFIRFSTQKGKCKTSGRFVDLKTFTFALTNYGGFSLKTACKTWDTPHKKIEVGEHGVITEEYLDYLVNDVLCTYDLWVACNEDYSNYPCDLPPEKLYSPASIGKGTLAKIGIKKPMKHAIKNFNPNLIGAIISTYYGGRTEIHYRAKPCKVRYCDFKSMYPTVNTLMGLWKFLICEEIECVDATEEVKNLIDNVVLDDLQNPEFWKELRCIAQIKPEDDLLPIRVNYQRLYNPKLQDDQKEPVFSEKRKIWDRTGAFFNPINSTLITSASRLMLGIVEVLGNSFDLDHAFCDTDSMALIVEDEEDEEKVAEIVDWFIPLNPYDDNKTIFEYEDDNYDKNGELRDLWFYGISSKRYCLYTINSDRSIVLVKPSAHGFGQYMDVIDDDEKINRLKNLFHVEKNGGVVGFEEMGLFEKIWSLYLNYLYGNISKDKVNKILDGKPMVKPFTISSYNLYNAFEALNKNKEWFNKYKPFSFMVVGNEIKTPCDNFRLSENEQNVLPIAPFHIKEQWKDLIEKSFINKKTGLMLQGKEFWGVSGSFNKHFWTYFENHPEFKFKNCKDSGFLRRRFITPNKRVYHTKEMKKMEEVNTGLLSFQNSIERYDSRLRLKESTIRVFGIELSKLDFTKLQRGTQKYLKALGWRDYHSKGVVIKEDCRSKTGFREKDVDFNGHPCYMSKQTFHDVKSENTLPNKETIEKAVFNLLFTMLLPEEIPYFENYTHLNTTIIIERLIEIGVECND